MTDNQPISLGQSDAPQPDATPSQGLTPRQLADQRISGWFSGHGQPYVSTNGGFAASIRPADSEGAEPVQLRVMVTDTRPPGILFAAAGGTRYPRDKWPDALTACNVWNGREPAARARLAVNDWEHDQDAPIVLETWLVLLPTTSQDVVSATGDGLVSSATRFWFTPLKS
jgi:hypothetical protein